MSLASKYICVQGVCVWGWTEALSPSRLDLLGGFLVDPCHVVWKHCNGGCGCLVCVGVICRDTQEACGVDKALALSEFAIQ